MLTTKTKTYDYSGIRKSTLTLILTLITMLTFGQCENLTGTKEEMDKWQAKYIAYFNADSSTQFIQADSVLIYYLSNKDNETNYGMPCCYYLADKYAQTELNKCVNILYSKLEKQDSANFVDAQKAWRGFYESEWDFLRQAFIAYANLSKYGLGREIMIATQSRKYHMIKERILTVKDYIEIATTE